MALSIHDRQPIPSYPITTIQKGEVEMRNKIPYPTHHDSDDEKNKQKQKKELQKKQAKFAISYLIVSLIGLWLFQEFILNPLIIRATEIPYSEFKAKIR